MMNGPEKSDPAIVATKLANKAQPSAERSAGETFAAEPVERRAGTKGNAGQQSTRRTQSRESVSQALERVRKVARERKKEKFTALLHHINIDLLEEAFYELKTNAAPGVDRLTWKDYEADLEHNIEDLHARVQRQGYRIWLNRARRKPLSHPARLIFRRMEEGPGQARRMLSASLRRMARFSGALSNLARLPSSSKWTSSTQCNWFSIVQ
jgi:RNA-directed DNA polymerase